MKPDVAKSWYVVKKPDGAFYSYDNLYRNVTVDAAVRFDYRNDAFEVAKRDGAEVYIVNMTCSRVEEDRT